MGTVQREKTLEHAMAIGERIVAVLVVEKVRFWMAIIDLEKAFNRVTWWFGGR